MRKKNSQQQSPSGQITETPIHHELETRYLAYALSTIISRSLPDVRDGLKPVHRRILFAMRALHLNPKSAFKKSARVVGDVIGKFHPHGDQAAYDAMVRLAQDFAVRYPLVDGQGNFGNVDGDSAAAMRYTEARLTSVAEALLEDLDKETVDMKATYDGSLEEPVVLPARFPNLLANGSTGIAVGMSTSVPPHNVGEILDACLLLTNQPDVSTEALLDHIPGPDFPTGGVLVTGFQERLKIYQTGKGAVRLRCNWIKETLPRGAWQIAINEIPYHVQKSRLIEQIAQLIVNKKTPFLADVRDESDEAVRIVLEPRSNRFDPEVVMTYLFRHTDLESRVTINLNVITAAAKPEVLPLKALLQAWLDHRFEVNTRRSRFELKQIEARLHLLAAYLLVHLNIDEVIEIIKENDHPAPVLMERFHLDKEQAEAVLNMRLRHLRRLEEMAIRREMKEKEERAATLKALLDDDRKMWQLIRRELRRTKKEFADPRRTALAEPPKEIEIKPEDLVQKEPLTAILTRNGWVKTVKGHGISVDKLRFKGDDRLRMTLELYSTDMVSFVTNSGKVYSIQAHRIQSGKGFGEPLTNLFALDVGDDVLWFLVVKEEQEYFVATRISRGFRIMGKNLTATTRKGRQVIGFAKEDQLLHIHAVQGEMLASISHTKKMLVCPVSAFPCITRGQGVRVQRMSRDGSIADVITFDPEKGVTLDSGKRIKTFTDLKIWTSHRASAGATLPHGFMRGAIFYREGQGVIHRDDDI
ncbi:DNA topoisomerase IV subunit A [Magnetococcales bacterium HHB-1]